MSCFHWRELIEIFIEYNVRGVRSVGAKNHCQRMCQIIPTPILKKPNSQVQRVPGKAIVEKTTKAQALKLGKTFTQKLFEAFNVKIFNDLNF
jgi:hypothetical protein